MERELNEQDLENVRGGIKLESIPQKNDELSLEQLDNVYAGFQIKKDSPQIKEEPQIYRQSQIEKLKELKEQLESQESMSKKAR